MKRVNRIFTVIISLTLSAGILAGCTSSKLANGINNTGKNVNVVKPEDKNSTKDVAVNKQNSSADQNAQNTNTAQKNTTTSSNSSSKKISTPVKKPAPSTVVKKVPTTVVPPVSKVTAKQSAAPVPASAPAVQASSSDELTSLVESYEAQGKDLIVTFGGNIQKDGIIEHVMNIVENSEYSGYISGIDYSLDDSKAYIHFNYKMGTDVFLSQISIVNSKVQQIIDQVIKPGMSPFDKELALHDYVVNHTKYDYNNLVNNTLPEDSFTAYGVFMKGTAVCQGYAEAMYRLLNQAGLKTLIITGKGNGVAHAWNLVNIGGAYYHLDATFDDPVSASGDMLTYNYFNVTDAEISRDHTWDSSQYPSCTSNSYNYFVYNNLIANDKTEYYNIVKSGLQNRQTVIRCETASYNSDLYAPDIVLQILRDNSDINYVDLSNGYSYSYDPNSKVMEFHISYK